ncbi:MAG: ribonuclease Z [Deltaproteobacteria bacterium]|nr:MAG: ribonuclease Z [Deltaproteobacteria bacterium]
MEIIIIGSGTGVPSQRRGAPAVALQAAGRVILLDLGAGTLRALLNVGLDFTRLDIIGLSHFHIDHVGDLAPFLFATHYSLGYQRQIPFYLLAAQGFKDFFRGLQGAFGDWIEPPPGLMIVKELSTAGPDQASWDDLLIKTAPVNHIASSIAFRVEAEGQAVVYSGDTDWSDSLIRLASGADLLILEAANPTKIPGHLTPAEAGRLAARTGVPRLVLTHFYPPCDQMDVVAACAQEYSGEIIRAEDGLRLKV